MEIPAPEKFDFVAEHWPAWKARFLRFRSAADLANKAEIRQVNTLIYSMGDRAKDIFNSFKLSDTDAAKFSTVLDKYDNFFIVKKNVIFERAQFNLRKHQPVLIDSSDVIEHYVSAVTDALPLKDVAIEKIKTAMTADATLKLVATYCANTWPSIKNLSADIIPYWHSRDALTVKDDIIFYNARLVISSSLRQYTLESLHVGHLGIAKCRAKARTAVWWPKISSDIERHVASHTS